MRSTIGRSCARLAPLSCIAIGLGCGGGPALVPASGTVTLDGKPLEGATLSFIPAPSNAVSTSGTDITGPSGNFRMTYNGRSGLSPGKYRVAVSKTEEVLPKGRRDLPVFAKASVEKQLMGIAKETIPQKFDKEIEIPPEGATDFALDFKSKGKK